MSELSTYLSINGNVHLYVIHTGVLFIFFSCLPIYLSVNEKKTCNRKRVQKIYMFTNTNAEHNANVKLNLIYMLH